MTGIPATMRAWVVEEPGSVTGTPLRLVELPVPGPAPGELLVQVRTCGVCRTDLHLTEGDLAPHAPGVVPTTPTSRPRRALARP